jgi:serine/threonine protein kinase
MDSIEAATAHLHQLGLAHNDISPNNIMFDDENVSVLIDFDSCAPFRNDLVKGGCVAGWRGPSIDNGKIFKKSSVECDELAIKYLRDWLTEQLKEVEEGKGT